MNNILLNNEIKVKLFKEIASAAEDILFISAFCKKNIIEEISPMIKASVKKKRLLVRFQYGDITSGATDLQLYETCKKYNWELYIKLDLHAKTYVFDKTRCIVGSANATNKGLSMIIDKANDELATFQLLSDSDYAKIESLLNEAVFVTDQIYEKLCKDFVDTDDRSNLKGWSKSIQKLFDTKITSLFTNDFPIDSSPLEGVYYDIMESNFVSEDIFSSKFKELRCYRWLKQTLETKENKEIYFGELSSILHNILVSDPPAFRKEVKDLIINLIGWIQALNIQEIRVDRPNYSQRIRLV